MEQNNKSFLKWALIGVLMLIFLILGGYIYLKNRATNTTTDTSQDTTTATNTTTDTTSQDTTDSSAANSNSILNQTDDEATATFNNYEKQAYTQAKNWNSAASLCAASVKISSDMSTQGITYSYIYCTKSDKTYYFNINFNSEGDYLRALIWQIDYIKAGLGVINRKYLQVSFYKALETAENDGGSTFRSSHNQSNITLNLYRREPNNYNYWTVQYEDRETPDKLEKQIDASTNEIINPSSSSDTTDSTTDTTNTNTNNSNL